MGHYASEMEPDNTPQRPSLRDEIQQLHELSDRHTKLIEHLQEMVEGHSAALLALRKEVGGL